MRYEQVNEYIIDFIDCVLSYDNSIPTCSSNYEEYTTSFKAGHIDIFSQIACELAFPKYCKSTRKDCAHSCYFGNHTMVIEIDLRNMFNK